MIAGLIFLAQAGCNHVVQPHDEAHADSHAAGHHHHKIVITCPLKKTVITTQQYVCQIHSCRHIEVRSLEGGYLEAIGVNEGQAVKKGDLLFKIVPTLFEAKLNSEIAEAKRMEIELKNAQDLSKKGIVSQPEVSLKEAELAKAKAKVDLARAELNFTEIRAPFDGIVDRQRQQLGSLIEEGSVLTTCSDNSVMWVYFNVPESRYLEYKSELDKDAAKGGDQPQKDHLKIELKLANGSIFAEHGKIGAIEADFNNTTGNIAFRADFPNPSGLLRNGQTGTVLIHNTVENALVIPQRATFEILAKQYVYVVDEDNIVHQRDIVVASEQDDIFVIKSGLETGDKIVLEGVRDVRDGDKVDGEFIAPGEILDKLKYHAE